MMKVGAYQFTDRRVLSKSKLVKIKTKSRYDNYLILLYLRLLSILRLVYSCVEINNFVKLTKLPFHSFKTHIVFIASYIE